MSSCSPGAYFRVRLVSAAGEPILAPRIVRRLFDAGGNPIADAPVDQIPDPAANGGTVTIGPLPRGVMTLAVDTPLFAATRLPDVNVTDATRTIDGGTVVIQQPGAVLSVAVVDALRVPVPNHAVFIEDPRPRSPLAFRSERTDPQGRATFSRLAAGQYLGSTPAMDRCGGVSLTASRLVSVATHGTVETPLVIGGRATFRITSPLGPERGVQISASPEVQALPSSSPLRMNPSGCPGVSAFLPLRVVNERNEPVRGASIVWTGSGGRVQATTTAAGDALLEGVGSAGGALTVLLEDTNGPRSRRSQAN